jgi:hypothetical protein
MSVVCLAWLVAAMACGGPYGTEDGDDAAFDADAGDAAQPDAGGGDGSEDASSSMDSSGADATTGDADDEGDAISPSDASPPSDGAGPDAQGECSRESCGLLPQCGCDEGEGCYVDDAVSTCSVAGTATRGELCDEHTDCAPGLACHFFPGLTGTCEPMCRTDAECPETFCGELYPTAPIGACMPPCDVVTGGLCPGDVGCRVARLLTFEDDWRFGPVCGDPSGGEDGAACLGSTQCAPGYACVVPRCRNICLLGAEGVCPDGRTCTSYTVFFPGEEPLTVDGVEYGICA